MNKIYIVDKEFNGADFSVELLAKGEYENCVFKNCIFAEVDIKENQFVDCDFIDCDLTMSKVAETAFRSINFKGCKLIGVHFDGCNPFLFAATFEKCNLNLATFCELNLKGIQFKDCNLQEVDFSGTNLSESVFDNCDLSRTVFKQSDLSKADFRTSPNFTIDPGDNNIKRAKFSKDGLVGLLRKYNLIVE